MSTTAETSAAIDAPVRTTGETPVDPGDPHLTELSVDLRLAILRLSRRLRNETRAADLSEAQFCVLAELTRAGTSTPRALAEHAQVRPPSMSRTLDGLAAIGLIERRSHPDDGRQVIVELSAAGVDVVDETRRRRNVWMADRLAELAPAERELLASATTLIRRLAST